jgi:hypothetical protein
MAIKSYSQKDYISVSRICDVPVPGDLSAWILTPTARGPKRLLFVLDETQWSISIRLGEWRSRRNLRGLCIAFTDCLHYLLGHFIDAFAGRHSL